MHIRMSLPQQLLCVEPESLIVSRSSSLASVQLVPLQLALTRYREHSWLSQKAPAVLP